MPQQLIRFARLVGEQEGTTTQLVRSHVWSMAALVAVLVSGVPEASATVDLNGLWRAEFSLIYPTLPPATATDVCFVTMVQSGTSLSLSGPCEGYLNPLASAGGTIDPDTGIFSMTVFAGTGFLKILFLQGGGTASGFSGSLNLQPPPFFVTGTFSGQKCSNGQIDAGEACDDGNRDNFDCCDRTCQYEPSGSPCPDSNACTDDVCDGAGTCTHQNRTATCNDFNQCTSADACMNGICVGTALPDGSACDDSNSCTDEQCQAGACTSVAKPVGTACPDDGYQCTSDLCDGAGVCRHAQRSGPCDDGDPCTTNDSCFGGSCSGGTPVTCAPCLSCDGVLGCVPTLDTHCKQAGKSSIKLRDVETERVTWKWLRGDHTSPQDLGNPQLATDYAFCIYNGTVDVNGNPGLLLGARALCRFVMESEGLRLCLPGAGCRGGVRYLPARVR